MACFVPDKGRVSEMMVWAISDLHLDHEVNRRALPGLERHVEDWLLLGGDVSHRPADLAEALRILVPRYHRVVWVPGNHDLWSARDEKVRGQEKYESLVSICRSFGVLTPEDPYPTIDIDGDAYCVAPLFLLYDYSFRPAGLPRHLAVAWALEEDILCLDEHYLSPHPFPSREEWCHERCALAERRLAEVPTSHRLVLLNHFPLRYDLVRIRIPRFSLWCGTRVTESWHTRFNVAVVVSGHVHVRTSDVRDGVRFEEVSLGYPRQWNPALGMESYLRQILPAPAGTPVTRRR